MSVPIFDVQVWIDDLFARAYRIGLSIPKLCAEADVDPATVYRWKQGGNPNLRTFRHCCIRLAEVLKTRERELLFELLILYPDVAIPPAPAAAAAA